MARSTDAGDSLTPKQHRFVSEYLLDYEIYDKSAALERDYKRWGLSKGRLEHNGDIVITWQDQE